MNSDGFRTMIAGISGMGKSYWVKKVMIPELAKEKPVVVFDRKEEYAGRHSVDANKNWKGYSGIFDFFSYCMEKKKLKNGVYVINCQNDHDYVYGLNTFVTMRRPVSIVLDEAHDIFLDNELFPAKKYLTKLVRYGRADGIDITLISQRTKDIPPNIRSQFLGMVSFKQTHPDDVKALDERGWVGAEKVLALKERNFIAFGELPNNIKKMV